MVIKENIKIQARALIEEFEASIQELLKYLSIDDNILDSENRITAQRISNEPVELEDSDLMQHLTLSQKLEEIDRACNNSVLKEKNTIAINTLRLIKSAIKDKDIASRTKGKNNNIGDPEILSLLQSLIKQRKDSINAFKSAARDDLIAIELGEIDIISQFLPKQISESDVEVLITKIIQEHDFTSLKDMGNLMNNLKLNYARNIDMALAGKIAKSKLGN